MVHLAKQWDTVPSQLRCEIKGRDENRFEPFFFFSLLLLMKESFYVKVSRTHKMSASFTRISTQIWNSIPY